LISDTHGLLRPQVLRLLAGVDHILHAGDIGSPTVLEALQGLAPVTCVRGNTDHGVWAEQLPWTAEVEAGGHWVHLLHILADLALDPRGAGFSAVIYGHSHRPAIENRGGVLYVNPGSAGPRRLQLPISLGLLHVEPLGLRAELVTLEA
jgi:putative phosphoesterase